MTPLPEARFPQSLENEEKLGWLVSALDSGYTIPKKYNFGNIEIFQKTLILDFAAILGPLIFIFFIVLFLHF